MHFYVYYFIDGCYVYERTCGTREAAEARCAHLLNHVRRIETWKGWRQIEQAIFTIDHTIRGAFY